MALALYFSGTPPCPFYCCHSLWRCWCVTTPSYFLSGTSERWHRFEVMISFSYVHDKATDLSLYGKANTWVIERLLSEWKEKKELQGKKKRKNRRIRIEKLILKFEEEWWILIQSYLTVGANILELSRSHFPSLSFLLLFFPLCSFFFYCLRLLLTRWTILSLICTQNRHPCLHTDWVCSR